jgi:YfiH family protein
MQFIKPEWPAPNNIHAYTTTREAGYSPPPFASLNLGKSVNDDASFVSKNRELLIRSLGLPSEPIWLKQVHSNKVINIDQLSNTAQPEADASITTIANRVCIVMTADCLPVLICNRDGTKAAAIHAGWRGLASGILENAIKELNEPVEQLLAWLGPAIGPTRFEVSEDVVTAFLEKDAKAQSAFIPKDATPGKWLGNLYLLATQRLQNLGLLEVYGGNHCTYTDEKNFYSYRRDQGVTGRMATLIWLSA